MGNGADIEKDLREFMAWTREALSGHTSKLHEIVKHQVEQNGNVKLVMERERGTRECALEAKDIALANQNSIAVIKASTELTTQRDDERHSKVSSDVKWLRDNIWKLLLGGISLVTIIERIASLVNTPAP